jgi:hypothetical protein
MRVNAGGAVPGHPERGFLAFEPAALSARASDTLRRPNPSTLPHNVTFGVLADHSNQPIAGRPRQGFTLITSRPCVSTQAVTATTTTCPGAPERWAPPAGTPAPVAPRLVASAEDEPLTSPVGAEDESEA